MAKPVPSLGTPIAATNPTTQTWYEFFQSILVDLKFVYDFVKGYTPPSDDTKSDVLRAINNQTGTTYTFALTDNGKYCRFSNSSPVTVTVPPNSTVAFDAGTQIDVIEYGTGKVTLAQGSGVTINSIGGNKSLAAQYAGATLIKIDTDTWDLVGNLIA